MPQTGSQGSCQYARHRFHFSSTIFSWTQTESFLARFACCHRIVPLCALANTQFLRRQFLSRLITQVFGRRKAMISVIFAFFVLKRVRIQRRAIGHRNVLQTLKTRVPGATTIAVKNKIPILMQNVASKNDFMVWRLFFWWDFGFLQIMVLGFGNQILTKIKNKERFSFWTRFSKLWLLAAFRLRVN